MGTEKPRPLTIKERAWVRSLDSVLKAMPRRLLIVESADRIMIVDRDAARDVELCDGGADMAGVVLCALASGSGKITGTS